MAGAVLPFAALVVVLLVVVVVVAVVVVVVVVVARSRRRLDPSTSHRRGGARRRPCPPPRTGLVGTGAATITGADPGGDPAERRWDGGRRCLLAFLTGGCRPCQLFWTALSDPAATAPELAGLAVVVVTPGPGTESRRGITARASSGLQVIMSTEAWMDYGVRGAPWFVVVDGGVVQAEGTASSWADLCALVRA